MEAVRAISGSPPLGDALMPLLSILKRFGGIFEVWVGYSPIILRNSKTGKLNHFNKIAPNPAIRNSPFCQWTAIGSAKDRQPG